MSAIPQRLTKEESWKQIEYASTVVTQTYTLLDPTLSLALAVNEPVAFDRDYTVLTRGEGDLVALNVTGVDYTVVSRVADTTIEELRDAEEPYPDWVQERYLALPPIPDRVRQTAEEVVREANAVTRYDKARAIEAYVRKFTYDLTLEPPPLDADVVDYYLFDAQRGYCDYSATAMVVMLRSVGVASRYASGYAQGSFDHTQGVWVVTEDSRPCLARGLLPGVRMDRVRAHDLTSYFHATTDTVVWRSASSQRPGAAQPYTPACLLARCGWSAADRGLCHRLATALVPPQDSAAPAGVAGVWATDPPGTLDRR